MLGNKNMDLLQESAQIKAQALNILEESRILDYLKNYGEVNIVGSYKLDVMLRPDIDIFVCCDSHDIEKAHDTFMQIMKSKYFEKLSCTNWIDFPSPFKNLQGFYIQPQVKKFHNHWKLDIWLVESHMFNSEIREFEKLLKEDNENHKKRIILNLKKEFSHARKYQEGINGNLIYEAVLVHNITAVQEFKNFIKENHKK